LVVQTVAYEISLFRTEGFAMNKTALFSLVILIFCINALHGYNRYSRNTGNAATYVGSLCFPASITKKPDMVAYYKGYQVDIHGNVYEFKDNQYETDFYILFTLEKVIPHTTDSDDPNTVHHFKIPLSGQYKCFKISKQFGHLCNSPKKNKPCHYWNTQQVTLQPNKQNTGLAVPENTLVVLANPAYIEGLEQNPWISQGNSYKLPCIIFKKTITQKQVDAMGTTSVLLSLDLKPFNRAQTVTQEIHRIAPCTVCSVVTE
jgi:hypothetical protein